MPTIDVHQHLWPETFVDLLARRERPPRLVGAMLELPGRAAVAVDLESHRLETRLALLDRCGVETAFVCLSPTLGEGTLAGDDWGELRHTYENGVLELARASKRIVPLAAGGSSARFPGTCIGAPALLDLDVLAPTLDELEQRGAFLFVHPGPSVSPPEAPAWWPTVVEHTSQMQAAYAAWLDGGPDRWPRLRVVFAILAGGGPFHLERLQSRGISIRDSLHENVLFEISSYGRRALELCLSTLGVSQVLYGSDAPWLDPSVGLDVVRGFGDAVLDALWNRNPSRLLG